MTTTNAQVVRDQIQISEMELGRKTNIIQSLDKASTCMNQVLAWIAGCSLLLMILLTVLNGLFRLIYKPFSGATEIVGWLCAVTCAFGLGYTQVKRGYVEIDALVECFPLGVQRVIRSAMLLGSAVFFGFASWKIFLYGLNVARNGNLSETMGIAFYPLILLVSLGFLGLTMALFVDFLKETKGKC